MVLRKNLTLLTNNFFAKRLKKFNNPTKTYSYIKPIRKNIDMFKTVARTFLVVTQIALLFNGSLVGEGTSLYAQSVSKHQLLEKEFKEKQTEYWRRKSAKLMSEMALREKLLFQLIENIKEELRARGKEALLNDELGFDRIYSNPDKLIKAYSAELDRLIEINAEIKQLQKQNPDSHWLAELQSLRAQILNSLEDRKLNESLPVNQRLAKLIQEYYNEVDSVLATYDGLQKLERKPKAQADQEILEQIAVQKSAIFEILEHPGLAQADSLVDEYFDEVLRLGEILDELSSLHAIAIEQSIEATYQIEQLQRSIVRNLSKHVLRLLGYDSFTVASGPDIAEFFKEWKALQYAEYTRDLAKYQIVKNTLLASGSPQERARMLERELGDALANYSASDYDLAEIQLNAILDDYSPYSYNLDVVHFYRAESNYARLLYAKAEEDYASIVKNFHDSEYMDDSLFRLLQISEKNGEMVVFFNTYNMLKSLLIIDEELKDKSHFLAGYVFLNDGKFEEAREALAQISEESKYHQKALYLQGIVLINQENNVAAIKFYEELAQKADTELRNKILLKLGYLHFEQGEYDHALENFKRISPDLEEFDHSLLAAAWTSFKQKDYEKTIEYANKLVTTYMTSDATYEALVLSAHNKKLMNRHEPAAQDLSYLANSRKAADLSQRYHAERDLILSQLNELERLEAEVIEQKDKSMYDFISQLRTKLQLALVRFEYVGTADGLMYEELQKERKTILNQIDELEGIIAKAHETGNKKIARRAARQRARLVKALEVYSQDQFSVDYFFDYPVAVREGVANYEKAVSNKLIQESEQEQKKINKSLQAVRVLKDIARKDGDLHAAATDLAILEKELSELGVRTHQIQTWLSENEVQTIDTDFNHVADFSGFGLSNATFAAMDDREEKISELSQNISTINSLIREHKAELELRKLKQQKEIERLEKQQREDQLKLQKLKGEQYFKETYFDKEEHEEAGERKDDSGEEKK